MEKPRLLNIAEYTRRWQSIYGTKKLTWNQLCILFANRTAHGITKTTAEVTRADKASKVEYSMDFGGFIGGRLTDGRNARTSVEFRDVLTIDLFAGSAFIKRWEKSAFSPNAAMIHTVITFKRGGTANKLRIIAPLSRRTAPGEYKLLAAGIAAEFDREQFDWVSFEPNYLAGWPNYPRDMQIVYCAYEGIALNVDHWLNNARELFVRGEYKQS